MSNRSVRRAHQQENARQGIPSPEQVAALQAQIRGQQVVQNVVEQHPMNDVQILGLMAAQVWAGSIAEITPERAADIAGELIRECIRVNDAFMEERLALRVRTENARRRAANLNALTSAECGLPQEKLDEIMKDVVDVPPKSKLIL